MYDVQAFQVLPQPPVDHLIAPPDPLERRHAIPVRGTVEVDEDVVLGNEGVERRQAIEKQVVHDVLIVEAAAVGQVAGREDDEGLLRVFHVAAVGEDLLVRLDGLQGWELIQAREFQTMSDSQASK